MSTKALILCTAILCSWHSLLASGEEIVSRFFDFNIEEKYAKLSSSLDGVNTAIRSSWPRKDLQIKLSKYLPIAVMSEEGISDTDYILMGRPIHIVEQEELDMKITNKLQATGLSIHFHGFEMENAIQYDGVVGLTQCPISPKESFAYKFKVEESPGTYWYHTHSGPLGVDAHNVIKAPLIVHPNTEKGRALVDRLNNVNTTQAPPYRDLLSYDNERILFFSDGFMKSEHMIEMYAIGGLFPPVQENDDGFVVANMEHDFGTLNGKLREVIYAVPGQKYKLRLMNGGSHFAYRVSIDGIPMTILATDSNPVKNDPKYTNVDEVIMHNAERFDVEIEIPQDMKPGTSIWIRADTLEARKMGYESGIRGILHVVAQEQDIETMVDNDIADPKGDIKNPPKPVEEMVTMNCYSKLEKEAAKASGKGGCHNIETLEVYLPPKWNRGLHSVGHASATVDFDVTGTPLHAHFARIHDEEVVGKPNWVQFVESSSHILRPDFDPDRDLHPHTNMMHVPEYSSVIIIWRSRTIMDHPMHLHGYKMEILETYTADRVRDCTLVKCNLYDGFDLEELQNIRLGSRPIKDTFIMPAGGAVATRIETRMAATWLAHCHMELHREDGMAFVLNVGKYSAPSDGTWLPPDFPRCDTVFLEGHSKKKPSCDCYVDQDAVLDLAMDPTYKCSRPYTCMYEQSQVAMLQKDNKKASLKMTSDYVIPGWAISLIIVSIVVIAVLCFTLVLPKYINIKKPEMVKEVKEGISRMTMKSVKVDENPISFWVQFKGLFFVQYSEYRPGVINVLRVVEVCGLGILAGVLFFDVGNKTTATSFGEKTSLIFFSTTLWSQTRMYPNIGNYFEWTIKDYHTMKFKKYDLLPIFLSRMLVVFICEAWWPFLFVMCAFPLAAMFGNVSGVFIIGFFLLLNNSCYIALGAVFGTLMPTVSLGMIGGTLVGQTTVICAGFFTLLPPAVGWIRYISPIFWTFSGIIKTAYKYYDTYECVKGNSAVGYNQCFLEQNGGIDNYKTRGINVAAFGDDTSESIHVQIIMLIVLYSSMQLIVYIYHHLRIKRSLLGNTTSQFDDEYERGLEDLGRKSMFLSIVPVRQQLNRYGSDLSSANYEHGGRFRDSTLSEAEGFIKPINTQTHVDSNGLQTLPAGQHKSHDKPLTTALRNGRNHRGTMMPRFKDDDDLEVPASIDVNDDTGSNDSLSDDIAEKKGELSFREFGKPKSDPSEFKKKGVSFR